MTAAGEERFDGLLESILDGRPIDWAAAASSMASEDRELLERLKVVATLAGVHRGSLVEDEVLERGRWGQLRVLELIGRGANGAVYRAWDEKLDREVALKLLPVKTEDGDQPAARARTDPLIEEGRVLARVRHPNVVTIYGADLIDGRAGLWMERVAGRTLDEIVESGRRFTPQEVAAIGVELCEAVSAVHAAGVVHRDIKASNVMVGDDGRPVLMDFGTGRDVDDSRTTLAGTPLYLAPELFRGAHGTPRRDIYSLGVLLYHLLTGSYPVRGADFEELRGAHARGDRHDLRRERPDVPAKLAATIDRALDPDPERRHPSAEALGAELRSTARPRFGRAARAVAASAVLLLLGVAAWELGSAARDRPSPSRALVAGLGQRLASVGSAEERVDPAIVVLPFDDLGDASDGAHLAEGLADEILHELARVDGLAVRSRHSSFSFRERPLDLRAIRERLRVDLALTGSVMRSGDQLRVTAQLVDLGADRALWSDRWDRPIDSSLDLFAITDDIARAIVNELRLTLGAGKRRYDLDLQTYDLYLRARAMTEVGRTHEARDAIELFEQVIARDPTFAPAYAGLADAYFFGSMPASVPLQEGKLPFRDAHAKIREAAERALELDPLLADAHAAMGVVYARENDWEASVRAFERALELDPSRTSTYTRYSFSTLRPLRRNDEAQRLLGIAREQDPLSLDVQIEIGQLELCTGRYDDAVARLEAVIAAQPELIFVQIYLVRSLIFAGRLDEAFAMFEAMGKEGLPAWYSLALVRAGRRAEAEALLPLHRDNSHRALFISAALGDLDSAFAALERQVVEEPQRVPMILTYPELAILYGDPRLQPIRQRFRLPPAPVPVSR